MSDDILDPSLSSRMPGAKVFRKIFQWKDTELVLHMQGLGSLCILPIETIQHILLCADMESLLRLQTVSQSMKRAVDSLRQFHTVIRCVPGVMRIMQATGTTSMVNCGDLYNALCKPHCDHCASPGQYLYLLSCARLCRECLTTNLRYRALRPQQAIEQYGLYKEAVDRLPKLTVPKYSPVARMHRQVVHHRSHAVRARNTTGWRLLDQGVVLRRSLAIYRNIAKMKSAVRRRLRALKHGLKLKEYNYPHMKWHQEPRVESAYSASVLFPWYNSRTGRVGPAVECQACRSADACKQQRYYCVEEEQEHIKQYGPVRNRKHVTTETGRSE